MQVQEETIKNPKRVFIIAVIAMLGVALSVGLIYTLAQSGDEALPEFQSASMEESELEYQAQNQAVGEAVECYNEVMYAYEYLLESNYSDQAFSSLISHYGSDSIEWHIIQSNYWPYIEDVRANGFEVAIPNLQVNVADACSSQRG